MNKTLSLLSALPLGAAALAGLGLAAGNAHAGPIELRVQPATVERNSGHPFAVDIAISGLDSDDLGGFDVEFVFDPTVIEYRSYSLGVELTDAVFGQEDLSDDSGAADGLLRLAEASWLTEFSDQPDAFSLVSVSFHTLRPGVSPLALRVTELSDGSGLVALDAAGVAGASVAVPLPGTLLLLPLGVVLLLWRMPGGCAGSCSDAGAGCTPGEGVEPATPHHQACPC
jgi:hypothetical protein